MDLKREKREVKFLKLCLFFAHVLPFFYMFRPYSYPSFITLWLIIGVIMAFSNWGVIFKNNNLIFGIFFLGEIVSILGYFIYDYSARLENVPYILTATFSFLLLPQFFFFVKGALLSMDDFKELVRFIVKLNFGCVLLGIILYILNPGFYVSFVRTSVNLSSTR